MYQSRSRSRSLVMAIAVTLAAALSAQAYAAPPPISASSPAAKQVTAVDQPVVATSVAQLERFQIAEASPQIASSSTQAVRAQQRPGAVMVMAAALSVPGFVAPAPRSRLHGTSAHERLCRSSSRASMNVTATVHGIYAEQEAEGRSGSLELLSA